VRRDYHNWYSSRLDRHMELLAYGQSGLPILVFPTARGRFYEYENMGMIQVLTSKIEAGNIQIFCVDSVDGESWYNRNVHPHERVRRHMSYEEYVLFEVAPFIKGQSGSQQLRTTGCDLGGYHALNFTLKHPDLAPSCVSMSGCFEVKQFMDGYYDNDFYFNNPFDYVPNIADPWFLDQYRHLNVTLAVADWDICLGQNKQMGDMLTRHNIPHALDVWTGGEQLAWPLWQRMATKFF